MTNLRSKIFFAMMIVGFAVAGIAAPQQASAHWRHHHHHYCGPNAPVVCAVNAHGIRSNFPNACAAHMAYSHVLHTDYCAESPGCLLYVPVCAWSPATHEPMTYNNLCLAEVANSTFLHQGVCH